MRVPDPGSWYADLGQIDKEFLKGRLQVCVWNADGVCVAVCGDDATARLIEALPDLLDVAQGALTCLRRLAHDGKHDMVCIEARDGAMVNVLGLTNNLRAAIAKANGVGA